MKQEVDQKVTQILHDGLEIVYKNIDFTKFRDDIDIKKTMDIINWTMLGLAHRYTDKLTSYEEIEIDQLKEWDSYAEILKSSFYK